MKKIYVWGARRTGTNYTECLFMHNFSNPVANLNKSHNLDYRYHGSKHDHDMPISEKFDPDGIHIGVIKNPLSWAYSRVKYEEFCGQNNPDHNPKPIKNCITEEYNGFYGTLRNINVDAFVTYESLINNFSDTMSKIYLQCSDLDKKVSDWYDEKQLIGPGRSKILRTQHSRPNDPARMYHENLSMKDINYILSLIDPNILEYYGYHNNGIWKEDRNGCNAL